MSDREPPRPPHPADDPASAIDRGTEAPRDVRSRYPVTDWHDAYANDDGDGGPWLVDHFIAEGSAHAVFAPAGVGKSLVALELAACIASGTPFAGLSVGHGRNVLYVDRENPLGEIVDRLRTFGFGPDDLGRLRLAHYPSLPGFDVVDGGRDLADLAQAHDAALVVLDTLAVSVVGAENDSDTFRAYARCTGQLLRDAGIATIRLDHAGHANDGRMRGSSAKAADVDTVWRLRHVPCPNGQRFELVTDRDGLKKRGRHGFARLDLLRADPTGLLSMVDRPTSAELDDGSNVEELAVKADRLGIPWDAGRDALCRSLRAAGHSLSNRVGSDVVSFRKDRGDLSADLSAGTPLRTGVRTADAPTLEPVPDRTGTAQDSEPAPPGGDLSPRPPAPVGAGAGTASTEADRDEVTETARA